MALLVWKEALIASQATGQQAYSLSLMPTVRRNGRAATVAQGTKAMLDVVEVEDGYVFTGIAASSDGDLTGCGLHNPAKTDLWVAKIDFEGNMLWHALLWW
jgi:hypothetical protein